MFANRGAGARRREVGVAEKIVTGPSKRASMAGWSSAVKNARCASCGSRMRSVARSDTYAGQPALQGAQPGSQTRPGRPSTRQKVVDLGSLLQTSGSAERDIWRKHICDRSRCRDVRIVDRRHDEVPLAPRPRNTPLGVPGSAAVPGRWSVCPVGGVLTDERCEVMDTGFILGEVDVLADPGSFPVAKGSDECCGSKARGETKSV